MLVIPPSVIETLHMCEGVSVNLTIDRCLVLDPQHRLRYTLQELCGEYENSPELFVVDKGGLTRSNLTVN